MELVIVMDGGLIQEVLSPDPSALKGLKITIVDYDTEDCSDDVLSQVQQSNGKWENAFVFQPDVQQLELNPLNIRNK